MIDENEPSALESRLLEVLVLKQLPRAGWVRVGIEDPESVAAHAWGVAWLVVALCPAALDRGRALTIAVLHDLCEARTGDITPHDGIPPERKGRLELEAIESLVAPLSAAEELVERWREFEEGSSAEGRFVRACDKLDMALQARWYAAKQPVDTAEFVRSALAELDDPELRALAGGGGPVP